MPEETPILEKTYLITDTSGKRYYRTHEERYHWNHKLNLELPYIRIRWVYRIADATIFTESQLNKIHAALAGKPYKVLPTETYTCYRCNAWDSGVTLIATETASLDRLPWGCYATKQEALDKLREDLNVRLKGLKSSLSDVESSLRQLEDPDSIEEVNS